jgi:hypothetical protein
MSVLGPDHPDALNTVSSLAITYFSRRGRNEEALSMLGIVFAKAGNSPEKIPSAYRKDKHMEGSCRIRS